MRTEFFKKINHISLNRFLDWISFVFKGEFYGSISKTWKIWFRFDTLLKKLYFHKDVFKNGIFDLKTYRL